MTTLQTLTAKQLQTAIRSMNKVSKNYGIKIAPKGTKEAMAKAFVEAVDLVVEKGGDGLDPFTNPVQNLYRALTTANLAARRAKINRHPNRKNRHAVLCLPSYWQRIRLRALVKNGRLAIWPHMEVQKPRASSALVYIWTCWCISAL
jgi:hypothetical protein